MKRGCQPQQLLWIDPEATSAPTTGTAGGGHPVQGGLDALEDQAGEGSLDHLFQGADGLLDELPDDLVLELLQEPVDDPFGRLDQGGGPSPLKVDTRSCVTRRA
ncbi:hypothetical protein FB465_2462 [Kitasatospora atroaurantiaca]|uniref:Uncharacterized protein n=1 Tax=Kitasatospora atroaurantiaca TaxID=285545 RepID=A0A561EPB3_9ACTN|nr:hypothetical protein FB465_2462 [Kitasatospora atroaurantiaca]